MNELLAWVENKFELIGDVSNENTQNISIDTVFRTSDILILIFSNFVITDLKNISLCTRLCKVVANDNKLWQIIRFKLDCPKFFSLDKKGNINEKEGIKNFLLYIRKRNVNCYYDHQLHYDCPLYTDALEDLRDDEVKFKKKESRNIFSSFFSNNGSFNPKEKSIVDSAEKNLGTLIFSEEIEDVNRLRKAVDIIIYLKTTFNYVVKSQHRKTTILAAEKDVEKYHLTYDDEITGWIDLDLKLKKLTSLPQQIVRFCNLQVLNLKSNHFTTFPEVILQLKKLQEVDLSYNHISLVPEEIWSLVSSNTLKINLKSNPLEITEDQNKLLKNQGEFTMLNKIRMQKIAKRKKNIENALRSEDVKAKD